jgi:hypothetical protein
MFQWCLLHSFSIHGVAKSFKFGKKNIIASLASTLKCFGHSGLNDSQFQTLEENKSEKDCVVYYSTVGWLHGNVVLCGSINFRNEKFHV